jgi:hypothetical protein
MAACRASVGAGFWVIPLMAEKEIFKATNDMAPQVKLVAAGLPAVHRGGYVEHSRFTRMISFLNSGPSSSVTMPMASRIRMRVSFQVGSSSRSFSIAA